MAAVAASSLPTPKSVGTKPIANGKLEISNTAVIARLVAQHGLTELEASWLLKAWKLGPAAKTRNRFACYLAGFMAGLALKTVEQEVKATRN